MSRFPMESCFAGVMFRWREFFFQEVRMQGESGRAAGAAGWEALALPRPPRNDSRHPGRVLGALREDDNLPYDDVTAADLVVV